MVATCNCDSCNCPYDGDNDGARLGAIMGEMARAGRDKLTLITSPEITSFGDWVEQLIAESTGKDGVGILPVVGESIGAPELYGGDRLFVYLHLQDDVTYDDKVDTLVQAGYPVLHLHLKDLYDLGAQFFLWEMATVVAGYRLGINPFDQPNVEAAKVLARQMVAAYQSEGELPQPAPLVSSNGVTLYGAIQVSTVEEALGVFLSSPPEGAYITLQAYVEPAPQIDVALQRLRDRLRSRTKLATTAGYGPRFLHSTGQLHKGDGGRGMFIQFTDDPPQDVDIPDHVGSPDSSISFGTLKMAQALGDAQALRENERRVIRFHFSGDVAAGLRNLTLTLENER
jgi:hypothetical protein